MPVDEEAEVDDAGGAGGMLGELPPQDQSSQNGEDFHVEDVRRRNLAGQGL